MKKAVMATAVLAVGVLGYACKDDTDNPTTVSNLVQLTATLNNLSGSTGSTATGMFQGALDQSSRVLSYTVTYSGITPTAITLDPGSTSVSATSGTSSYTNSILLAGAFPSYVSSPGSGTSTSPGSGTSTDPGSGTSTSPGSGTSTTPVNGTVTSPGSGTSTDPGSGTSTSPGSGTSTSPGSGTSTSPGSGTSTDPGSSTSTSPGSGTSTGTGSGTAVTLTSPVSGTVSVSQSRADSLTRGFYRINIRSGTYPNGEISGAVQVR